MNRDSGSAFQEGIGHKLTVFNRELSEFVKRVICEEGSYINEYAISLVL